MTLKKTESLKTFSIFEAIRSQMSFNCEEFWASINALNWFEDWLQFFLTSRQLNASEIFLGRLVAFLISYASCTVFQEGCNYSFARTNFTCDDTYCLWSSKIFPRSIPVKVLLLLIFKVEKETRRRLDKGKGLNINARFVFDFSRT